MKNYIVSIDGIILADKYDESVPTGNMKVDKTPNNDSMISLESKLDKSASLDAHISNIMMSGDITIVAGMSHIIDKLYLNIGVFYDTATCTVVLPNECIARLLAAFPQIFIRTVCYPCDDNT